MARKMDKYREVYNDLRTIDQKISKYNKAVRELKAQRDILDAQLMKSMQKSTEGTIDGMVAIKVKTSIRNTATIGRVMQYAPEMADKIIQQTESKKIEVF